MRSVKTAIIGIGHDHAWCITKTLIKNSDVFDLAGYYIPPEEEGRFDDKIDVFDGMKRLTLEEIIDDASIEAVAIETEDKFLPKYAQIAASNGKHIHMDKPGSGDLEEFVKLIDTVKEKNVVFSTGYMYRFNPYIIELKRQIAAGELGDIISIEAQMNCIHNAEKRNWLADYPGGMLHFLGCHLIDVIFSIQGKPERIIPLSRRTGLDDAKGEDFGMAVFEYRNGVSFAKTVAVEYGGFDLRQITVTGSKKTVELKPIEQFDAEGMFSKRTEYTQWEWSNRGVSDTTYFDRYDDMMKAFAAYVCGEKVNPITPDYELELYKTILKACGK